MAVIARKRNLVSAKRDEQDLSKTGDTENSRTERGNERGGSSCMRRHTETGREEKIETFGLWRQHNNIFEER